MSSKVDEEREEARRFLAEKADEAKRAAHSSSRDEAREWLQKQAADAATKVEHDARREEAQQFLAHSAQKAENDMRRDEAQAFLESKAKEAASAPGSAGADNGYAGAGGWEAGAYDGAAAVHTAETDGPTGFAWSRPVMTGVPPTARGGHAAGLVGNLLIVVGGHYYGGGGKFQYLGDVWAIDVDEMTWHNPICAGGGPSKRYGHSAIVIEYKLYVFGGRGEGGVLYNDLWCLDVETWTWERMSSTTAPPLGRFGHASLLIGNKIVVHGGWDGARAFGDLWVYDTEAFTWLKPKTAGPAPPPRYGHVMALSRDGRIVLYGGSTVDEKGRPQYLSDVKQLDTDSMVWRRCRVTGDHPGKRAQMASSDVANTLTVFGGWDGVSNSIVPDSAIVKRKKKTQSSDPRGDVHPHLFMLDLAAMEWTQPTVVGTKPTKRYGHSATPVGSKLLVFGGWDGNRPLNDVLQLEVAPLFDM